ncbi:MAG: ribonuclease HI family protein [Brachybacterium sp.]|uniref:ribonuclease HI family protein n=1 Tax=Brachybacterium sp. TaxID=1891286 RepID=UPI0026490DE9|nr:ribonuclease HI family protein [Brachybacterium sp.]MDN5686712.1 ribonuclease HI family protein [Brachybacterium sp.]
MTLTAAADGSALGNPGPAGWAWYIDENTWRAGGWPHGTNNMGELKAVLDLLEATAVDADQHLLILCDSQYVINSVTTWMPGWKRKGWRKKDGKPVLNVELLKDIDRALAGRSVEFEWVKGHSGHALNEAADQRANAAATAFSKKQDPQVGPGYSAAADAARISSASAADPTARTRAADGEIPSGSAAPPPIDTSADDLFSLFDEPAPVAESCSTASEETVLTADAPGATDFEQVTAREQALLSDALRADAPSAAELLHPSFTEIGTGGRTYDRDAILAHLAPVPGLRAEEFVADEVAPGVVLLQYTTSGPDGSAARSSLWVREKGRWLLRHHQGTATSGR